MMLLGKQNFLLQRAIYENFLLQRAIYENFLLQRAIWQNFLLQRETWHLNNLAIVNTYSISVNQAPYSANFITKTSIPSSVMHRLNIETN